MSIINKILFSVIMLLSCTSLCAMKRPSPLFGSFELPNEKRRCIKKSFFCSVVECERRDKPLKSKAALQSHEALKHSICPYCPNLEPFQNTGELVQHCKLMKHVPIFCSICEKYIKVSQRTTLQNHENKCGKNLNSGVERFCSFDWCEKSKSSFRSPSDLRFHLLTQHNICFHCSDKQEFDSRQLLIEHYEQLGHSTDFCQHCKKFITLPGSVVRLNAHRDSCEKKQKKSRELLPYNVLEFSVENKENISHNHESSLSEEVDLCALFTTNFDEKITAALRSVAYFDSEDSISQDYLNDVLSEESGIEIT